ncbi:MAG: PKD domain-containing protein [Planctomycetota bacterium]
MMNTVTIGRYFKLFSYLLLINAMMFPSTLKAAIGSCAVEASTWEAGSTPTITVTVDGPPSSVPATGRVRIKFPYGFKIQGAAATNVVAGSGAFVTFNTFTNVAENEVSVSNATANPSTGNITITFSGIKLPEHAGSTGPYVIQTMTAGGASVQESNNNVAGDTIVASGPFTFLDPLTRFGGPVKRNTTFKIKVGVADTYGNLTSGAPGTVTLLKDHGSGTFTPTLVSYSAGVAEFNCTYSEVGPFALSARLTVGGSSYTESIGNYSCYENLEGPSHPLAVEQVPQGLTPLDWSIEWEESLTPNVVYEVWQQYYPTNLGYQSYNSSASFNSYMDYAEFRATGNYNRYFSTFSKNPDDTAQWYLIGTTSYSKFIPNATYSSFQSDPGNRGEAAGIDNLPYGKFYTDKWFKRNYGAFRVVAVDTSGLRSISTHEVMRAPLGPEATPLPVPPNSILPAPESVLVYNQNGQVTISWSVDDIGIQPDEFHIYRKVAASSPGNYNEYAIYSRFEYFATTQGTSHTFTYDSGFVSYHEYSSFVNPEPYGIFKVVSAKFDKRKSPSSAESFTVPFNPFGSQSGVSLDIVQYPPTPVSADQGMKVVLRLVDNNRNPLYGDSSTQVQLSMPNSSNVTVQANGGYLHFNNIRQYVAGTHTMNFQILGTSTTLPINHTITADATTFVVRIDGMKLTPGPDNHIKNHMSYVAGTTTDETARVSFHVSVDAVDRHGNVSKDMTGRLINNIGIYDPSAPAGLNPHAAKRLITLTNGTSTFVITSDIAIARAKVTLDLSGNTGFVSLASVYFKLHAPVRPKWVTLDDVDHNGSTDRMIISFDAPIQDSSIPTSTPLANLYLTTPNVSTAVQAWTWNSYGVANDQLVAFILNNPESTGNGNKFSFYQQKKGKPQKWNRIKSTKGAYVADWVTTDATITLVNRQTSVVTSSSPHLATRNGTIRAITLDFSGAPASSLADTNRWFVVANSGDVLAVTGIGLRSTRWSVTVSLDGNALGNTGTPHVGFVNMDPNLVPTGLMAVAGGTSTIPAIELYWNSFPSPLFSQFAVFRSTSPTSGFKMITSTTNRNYSDTSITVGTTYYYRVRAILTGGEITQPSMMVSERVLSGIPTVSISATPTNGTAPLLVNFTGTALDNGNIVSYEWDFNTADGIAVNFYSATSPNAMFTYMESGSYTARLRVRDNDGNVANATIAITVTPPSNGPTANAVPRVTGGPCPLTVTFDDASTAGSSPIRSWEWDFQGDGIIDYSSAVTGNASWTYRKADTTFSSVKLRVTDGLGRSHVKNFTITVGSATNPPQVTLDAAAATGSNGAVLTTAGNIPYIVTFNAVTYDKAPGKIVRWQWDFNGDGLIDRITTFDRNSTAAHGSRAVTFSYTSPGGYSPSVTVWDNDGNTVSGSAYINVSTPTNANIMIVEPVSLDNAGGSQIMLRAVAVPNSIVSTVLFEYSTDTTNWTQIGGTISGQQWSYFRAMDISGFADNTWIYVRARCTDTNSGSDTSPMVKFKKVSNSLAELVETVTGGKVRKEVSFDGTEAQDIFTSAGAGIEIPLGAISNDAVRIGGLRLLLAQQGDAGTSYSDTDGLPTSGGLPTIKNLGNTYSFEISLSNGSHVTQPNSPLVLKIPYNDTNDDGIVDGTSIKEEDLAVYYYDVATGAWVRAVTWTIDTENNIIEVSTVHLTDFGMFATVVSGAIGGSAGGPGAAAAGLCLLDGQKIPLSLLIGLIGLVLVSLAWFLRTRVSAD